MIVFMCVVFCASAILIFVGFLLQSVCVLQSVVPWLVCAFSFSLSSLHLFVFASLSFVALLCLKHGSSLSLTFSFDSPIKSAMPGVLVEVCVCVRWCVSVYVCLFVVLNLLSCRSVVIMSVRVWPRPVARMAVQFSLLLVWWEAHHLAAPLL